MSLLDDGEAGRGKNAEAPARLAMRVGLPLLGRAAVIVRRSGRMVSVSLLAGCLLSRMTETTYGMIVACVN